MMGEIIQFPGSTSDWHEIEAFLRRDLMEIFHTQEKRDKIIDRMKIHYDLLVRNITLEFVFGNVDMLIEDQKKIFEKVIQDSQNDMFKASQKIMLPIFVKVLKDLLQIEIDRSIEE